MSPAVTWNGGRILEGLHGELSPQRFFESVWQREACLLRGRPDRFTSLFDRAAFDAATRRCQQLKAYSRDERGWPVETPIGPERAAESFAAGATLCASSIEGDPRLDAFLRAFAAEVLHAGEVGFNAYHSPDGQGFELHLDDHPVWILQIEGRKRWWYSPRPALPDAPATLTFPPGVPALRTAWGALVKRPEEASLVGAVLEPGDALYMPQGTWHRAAAAGRSLGLTLAVSRASTLELVQRAVVARLASRPEARRNLPGFWAAELGVGELRPELRRPLEEGLRALQQSLSEITADELGALWWEAARSAAPAASDDE
jgi:ribosomal protein L16 Arg81 hydroxylase